MDEKNVAVVDVSSFMLFEATGDSEANSELNMEDVVAAADDDDAQSCSCDFSDCYGGIELDDHLGQTHDQDLCFDDDDEDDLYDYDEGEVIDHQDWTDDDDDEVGMNSTANAGQHKKSGACVDSNMGLMSEMEKNRLFWEACLAS